MTNNNFTPQTVLPGDDVSSNFPHDPKTYKIGTGLHCILDENNLKITATKAGTLLQRKNTNKSMTYYIRNNHKRYIPQPGDKVLGIIEDRFGEYYKVNIFGPHSALLHMLSFEGASKRNRPQLHTGSLVYCRVVMMTSSSSGSGDMDPELSCKVESSASGVGRKDWMTDEGTYGELTVTRANIANVGSISSSNDNTDNSNNTGVAATSTWMRVSCGLARELLNPKNVVLDELAIGLPFEVAVGVNGALWVNSSAAVHTVLICNAVRNSEVLSEEQTRGMVRALLKSVGGVS